MPTTTTKKAAARAAKGRTVRARKASAKSAGAKDAGAKRRSTTATPAGMRPARKKAVARTRGKVQEVHQVTVGLTLVQNVEGHTARADSKEFKRARSTLHKIIETLDPNPFGEGKVQAHHGGSIWVHDGAGGWHLVLNWAGIEWSSQFCCDPVKVERLRQNAAAITGAFPATIPALEALGYADTDILTTPVTDARGIARYTDSIWNSCVPIPQPQHTGSIKAASPLASGVHSYPEPMCGIPRVMRDDFIPFVVDPATKTAAVVTPVAPRGSGDGRVRVVFTDKGNPLRRAQDRARKHGAALLLSDDHPVARRAFALQT